MNVERKMTATDRGRRELHLLDRYFGIPLVFALGAFRKKSAPPNPIRSIGVLASAAIGDTILLSAVLKDVAQTTGAKIHLFVGESNAEAAKLFECAEEITVLNVKNPLRAISLIEKETFDVWIDTGQWPRINSVFSFFAKASFKVGFQTPGQFRHFVYDQAIAHSNKVHELENFRSLFRWLNVPLKSLPHLDVQAEEVPGRIVIHAFAGGSRPYLKEWPENNWVQVINLLLAQGKCVALTGSPSDLSAAERIQSRVSRPHSVEILAGKLSLRQTAEVLQSAELVLSVNTGILHLASALGCRVLGVHGPTSVKRWGPIGPQAETLQSTLPCSPCLNLGFDFGCNQNRCMQAILPEEVIGWANKHACAQSP